jgi:hypothetical protein
VKLSYNAFSDISHVIILFRFTSVDPETGIRRVATSKDTDKLQKFGLYLNMYKENWKRAVIKYEEE